MNKSNFTEFVKTIKSDLYRYCGAKGLRKFLCIYYHKPGFRYIFWMRLAGYLYKNKLLIVLYCISSWIRHRLEIRYGISIPHTTQIGEGLFIGHFGGIVVNEKSVIGRNCNISHGVTIGQKNRGQFKGCPQIGNNVYIGPGAMIIGSVCIGSKVAIGANSVVTKNVNNNEVVVGNPSRVISSKGSDGYVNWVVEN